VAKISSRVSKLRLDLMRTERLFNGASIFNVRWDEEENLTRATRDHGKIDASGASKLYSLPVFSHSPK
jgi:hypothetical protein